MALLEKEVIRFAQSLEDYEHVSVTDIGGWGPQGFWLVVHDHRFDLDTRSHPTATTGTSSPRLRATSSTSPAAPQGGGIQGAVAGRVP
jgi:hypothetical protein